MDVHAVSQNVVVWLTAFGFKVLGALGFWIVGRWGTAMRNVAAG